MFALLLFFLFLFFPIIEIYLMIDWLGSAPLWAFLYLLVTIVGGLFLIKLAKFGFSESLAHLRENSLSLSAVPLFLKMWIAGVLLVFPGYLSDVAAIIMLLLPAPAVSYHDGRGDGRRDGQEAEITEVEAQVIEDDDEDKQQRLDDR